MFGLSPKEIIELRLKCLEPYVTVASKVNIEQDVIIKKAEIAWEYCIKPLISGAHEINAKASSKSTR